MSICHPFKSLPLKNRLKNVLGGFGDAHSWYGAGIGHTEEFCAVESCGKCTPCRIGSVRGVEIIDKIGANKNRLENLELLEDLCETLDTGSLCAMGGLTPMPVRSAIKYFPEDFAGRVRG